jgi:ribosomal protein L18E
LKTYSFDKVLELVEEMSNDDQITLIELIEKRLREKRRDKIALNIMRANEEYAQGQVFRGTVDEVMA